MADQENIIVEVKIKVNNNQPAEQDPHTLEERLKTAIEGITKGAGETIEVTDYTTIEAR